MNVVLSEKGGSGTLWLAGRAELRVTVTAATGGAGLFRSFGRSVTPLGTTVETSGWVVMPDGSVRGLRRVDRSGGSVSLTAAPKLDPKAMKVTAESLLPTCKPVKPQAGGIATTDPPGCGLPDGRTPPAPATTGFTITRRAKAVGLTDAQLVAAATRSRVAAQAEERKRGLKLLTAEDRRAFEAYAAKLRSKATVLTASERLRAAMLSGDYERIGARLSEYETALAVAGLSPLPPALQQRKNARRNALPTSATAFTRGPSTPSSLTIPNNEYALGKSVTQSGPFVTGATAHALASDSGATAGQVILRTDAWVGWASAADVEASAVARFKVPAGVSEVELELDASRQASATDSECSLGSAYGSATQLVYVEQINADGSGGTVYGASSMLDWGGGTPLCPVGFGLLNFIPDPPLLSRTEPIVLKFVPPPAGGAYLIKLWARAKTEVVGQGEAKAYANIWLKSTTVRFRR